MKRLIALQIILTLSLGAGIGMVSVMARLWQEPLSPVRRDDVCRLPCWRGILPGRTLANDAHQVLTSYGYRAQNIASPDLRTYFSPASRTLDCDVRIQQRVGLVFEIRFLNCVRLRLGDVFAALGNPHSVAAGGTHINFDEGRVRVTLTPPDCHDALSPSMRVSTISLIADTDVEVTDVPWRGFRSPYDYVQDVPAGIVVFGC